MKTNLLFAAALSLSMAGFSQNTVAPAQPSSKAAGAENAANVSLQTNSSVRTKTSASGFFRDQAEIPTTQTEQQPSSLTAKPAAESEPVIDNNKALVEKNSGGDASFEGNSISDASFEGNSVSDASFEGNSVSDASFGNNNPGREASLNNKIHAASSGVMHLAGNIRQALKPHPISFNMVNQIRTHAGILIK